MSLRNFASGIRSPTKNHHERLGGRLDSHVLDDAFRTATRFNLNPGPGREEATRRDVQISKINVGRELRHRAQNNNLESGDSCGWSYRLSLPRFGCGRTHSFIPGAVACVCQATISYSCNSKIVAFTTHKADDAFV